MSAEAYPVVVGVDGSGHSVHALRWAADEAAWRQRPLRVVHALGSHDPYLFGAARHLVDDAVGQVHRWQPGVPAVGVVCWGMPTAEMCAESRDAELVVVGGRGRGGITGLLLGSVSGQVAAHAACPVLVVHNGRDGAGPDAAQPPVLVGVDGSPAAELAVGMAFEESAARGVGLIAVRAWQAPPPPWRSDVRPLVLDVEELATAERRLLTGSIAAWRAKYPQVPVQLRLIADHAGAALVTASRDAQLAVVGTRGTGGFAGLLLCSASHQLLHHAHCPVLLARKGR